MKNILKKYIPAVIYIYITLFMIGIVYIIYFIVLYIDTIIKSEIFVKASYIYTLLEKIPEIMLLVPILLLPVYGPIISIFLIRKTMKRYLTKEVIVNLWKYSIPPAIVSIIVVETIVYKLGYSLGDISGATFSGAWLVCMGSTYFFAILYAYI